MTSIYFIIYAVLTVVCIYQYVVIRKQNKIIKAQNELIDGQLEKGLNSMQGAFKGAMEAVKPTPKKRVAKKTTKVVK